jgi:hypothetical protein
MIGFDPMVEVVTLNAVVLNATELVEGRVWMIEVKLLDNFVQMQVRAHAAQRPGLQSRRRPKPYNQTSRYHLWVGKGVSEVPKLMSATTAGLADAVTTASRNGAAFQNGWNNSLLT